MREWLTPKEIAAEQLPIVPHTERGIQLLADREGWNADDVLARRRSGRGGGMEYNIGLLPTLSVIAYRQKHMRVGLQHAAANDEPAKASSLTGRALLERDARLAILRAFETFKRGQGLNDGSIEQLFILKYQAGSLRVDQWIRDCVKALSKSSLARWRREALADKDRLAVDRGAHRKGKGVLETANNGAVKAAILALLADNMHFSAEHIRDVVASEFGETLTVVSKGAAKSVALPPIRTFQHHLKALRETEKVTLMRVQNPDRFRSTMAPRGTGTLAHVQEPNTLWQIDASPIDALCTDGRHAIYVCLDIATRRMVLLISRTPRASAVALLIRKAILLWGAPDKIKTDNGSDFTARDTHRLFTFLGIEIELSDAYTPQQKGHVERAIGDFQRDCATMLPGFVGHSVTDRKAIEDRKSFAARLGASDAEAFGVQLSGEEMQDQVDRWLVTREHEAHSGLRGETPFMRAARSALAERRVDERALDVLLMTVPQGGTRRVTSSGIRVDGSKYMTPTILPGTEVLVRMDSADLGVVYAFTPDGQTYLGVGICPALSGLDPVEVAKACKAAQNEITARGAAVIKAEIRRMKKAGAYHERILGVREARLPNVVPMPKRQEEHSTPQIAAALDALDQVRPGAPLDPKVAAEQQRIIAEMEAADMAAVEARYDAAMATHEASIEASRTAHLPETVAALPESAKDRYRRHLAVRRRMEAGETADPKDLVLLGRYESTHEYRGQKDLHDDFGDAYLAR